MTANELHNEIAAYVRHRVNEEEYRARVANTVSDCADCGSTYTHDLLARLSLNRTAGPAEPAPPSAAALPDGTAAGSTTRVASTTSGEVPRRGGSGGFISASGAALALIVAAASLAIILSDDEPKGGIEVVSAPSTAPMVVDASRPKNLFNEATATYRQVASGAIGVQVEGPARLDIEKHFASNGIDHPIRFPAISKPLAGGIVTRYGDRNVAQLVYAGDGQAVYVLEVPVEVVRRGTSLYVTEDVLARLDRGERIIEETAEGEITIVYRDDQLVMAVVSNVDRAQLERMLKLG